MCIRRIAEYRIESFGNITQLRGLQILQAFMYAIPGLNFKNRKWYNYLNNQIYTLKSYKFFFKIQKGQISRGFRAISRKVKICQISRAARNARKREIPEGMWFDAQN